MKTIYYSLLFILTFLAVSASSYDKLDRKIGVKNDLKAFPLRTMKTNNIVSPEIYSFSFKQQRIKAYFDWIQTIAPGNEEKYREFGTKEIKQYLGVYNELLERLYDYINYMINEKGSDRLLPSSDRRPLRKKMEADIDTWWWEEVIKYRDNGKFSQNFVEYLDALRKNYNLIGTTEGYLLSIEHSYYDYVFIDYDLDIQIINKGSKYDNAFLSLGARFFPIMGYNTKKVFLMSVRNEECQILGLAKSTDERDSETGNNNDQYVFSFSSDLKSYSIAYFKILDNNCISLVSPAVTYSSGIEIDQTNNKRALKFIKKQKEDYCVNPLFVLTSHKIEDISIDEDLPVDKEIEKIDIELEKIDIIDDDHTIPIIDVDLHKIYSLENNSKDLSAQEQRAHKGRSI